MDKKNQEPILVYKEKLNPTQRWELWISRVVIWLIIIVTMFPIVVIIGASLAPGESFSQAGRIFPTSLSLHNYKKVILETDFLIWLKNSLFVCTSVAVLQVLITLPSAFAFSRLKFWGRKNGLMTLLLLQMFPTMMALPAILVIAYRMNFMDNLWALVLLFSGGSAYSIWLLKGFIDGIPKELDEAAYVDGANVWQTFTMIVFPLTKSMLVVIFVFAFIGVFSEFVMTSALMKDAGVQTMATGMQLFIKNKFATNWTGFAAAAIMGSLPIVIIATLAQKFIAKGLVAGGVKE